MQLPIPQPIYKTDKDVVIAPGSHFATFLDSIYEGRPLHIVETGCMRDLSALSELSDGWSTLYIARWVKHHPTCKFDSVDLNINAIDLAHSALEAEGLAKYCTFHRKDSLLFLSSLTWLDFAFLDSCDGLEHGLAEFKLAASAGCRLVVMDDYQTKAATAIKFAKESGWKFEAVDRYSVLRRP